jgi:hypothetical protein
MRYHFRTGSFTPEPIYKIDLFDYFYSKFTIIKDLQYIPDGTYFTKIPPDVLPTLLYPSIRWVGILNATQKI